MPQTPMNDEPKQPPRAEFRIGDDPDEPRHLSFTITAVYEKQIGAAGNTVQYTKTTYDAAGNIVHVKDKLNGGVFP